MRDKAEKLRALHEPGRPLVLVNAWDAASARVLEKTGFPAVATTSAGIANAEGYPDGEQIPRSHMLERVARICGRVSVPVTADMEAGYGDTPEEMQATAIGVLEAGAVGLNLEDSCRGAPGADSLVDLALQVEKIRTVRKAAASRGVPIVINARTDAYLNRVGAESGRLEETVRRGKAYRDAGADCVFVPGVTDPATIAELVRRLACPVNVLAVAGSPSIGELAALGVARVSLGSGPMRASISLLQRLAGEVLEQGTYGSLEGIVSYAALNEIMR